MVGDKGTILHSVNGGVTWAAIPNPAKEDLFGVSFVSPEVGWVVGARGAVWHTKDEGVSWQFQHTNSMSWLEDVKFVDPLKGVAVGSSGTILRTEDGGENWKRVDKNIEGVVVRAYVHRRATRLHRRRARRLSCELTTVARRGKISKAESMATCSEWLLANRNDVLVVGEQGSIIHSKDAGQTWEIATDDH